MSGKRQYLLLAIIVTCLVTPAGVARLIYHLTKDPFWQPLGITQEKLAAVEGEARRVAIGVHVDWGSERDGGMTRAELRDVIADVFSTRTDAYYFRFQDVPGVRIGVTFNVGPNRYGPYPPSRMIDGIVPALVALKMTQKTQKAPGSG